MEQKHGLQQMSLNNKLITTQRAMERKMVHLRIRDKVNHNKIREKTKVKDIIEKETKWRWAGHVLRVQDNRWTRRLTEWQPRTGKRKRGRQKKRWRDDITAHMGTATWTRVARERDKWKFYEEGFVQQMVWTIALMMMMMNTFYSNIIPRHVV